MKIAASKLLVVAVSAIGGLILFRFATRLGETLQWIDGRHPDMGVEGWVLLAMWAASAVSLGVVSDHFWKNRTLFMPGDVPVAIVLFYMTASALIYMIWFGA